VGKISLVVDYTVKPGKRDAFVKRVREHGETCLNKEPGCLHFDVLVPREDPNRLCLYEVYTNQAALDIHVATPYMAEYRSDIQDFVDTRTLTVCDLVTD